MNKQEAYEIVYNDLLNINMFTGKCDPVNGNTHFIHGISTVMEHIALIAGHSEEYEELWFKNVHESERKWRAKHTNPLMEDINENPGDKSESEGQTLESDRIKTEKVEIKDEDRRQSVR